MKSIDPCVLVIFGANGNLARRKLIPALFRLEARGLLKGEWGVSDNNRRAKFYRLTAAGRRQLKAERDSWHRVAAAMTAALAARAGEV